LPRLDTNNVVPVFLFDLQKSENMLLLGKTRKKENKITEKYE